MLRLRIYEEQTNVEERLPNEEKTSHKTIQARTLQSGLTA